jgi:hypothetical protein
MLTHFLALGLLDGAGPVGVQPPVQPPAVVIDTSPQAQSFVTDFGLVTLAQRRQMAEAKRRLDARLRDQQVPRGQRRQAIERAQRLVTPPRGAPAMTPMERLALARTLFG